MKFILRFFILYMGALLIQLATLWLESKANGFDVLFSEGVRVYPFFEISLVSSMLSLLFPAAYWAGNNGQWSENGSVEVFFLTSFLIIPLVMAFPLSMEAEKVFIDNGDYFIPLLSIWPAHGLINAIHVKQLIKLQKAKQVSAVIPSEV